MRIRWLRTALRNLDHHADYIAKHDPITAQNVVRRIQAAADWLAEYPSMAPTGPVSGRRRGCPLGHGFELADRLAAEQQRDEGADRYHYQYRAEEYRRGTGVRFHQEGRQHSGKDPPGRLAKRMSAPAQGRRELLGKVVAADSVVKPVITAPAIIIAVA